MCAPKSKGGKRCLYHAALSKFSVRSTQHKTGAPEKEITATMSALNREGKNLPAPDKAEVDTYLASQKFATEYDPSLSEHERKIQLSQLDRATREAEEGVSGGNFHAWKNILPVMTARVKRRALAATLIPVTMFGMAGCAAQFSDASPAEGADPSVSQDYVNPEIMGDTKVTDEFGEYTNLKLATPDQFGSLAADSMGMDAASLSELGINNKEELKEAYTQVSNFVTEGIYDSPIVDHKVDDQATTEWVDKLSEKYNIHPTTLESLKNPEKRESLFIGGYNPETSKGFLPLTMRDGRSRANQFNAQPLYVENITAADDGRVVGTFQFGMAEVAYRVSDESAIQHLMDNKNITKEEALVFQKADSLTDGKVNSVTMKGYIMVGLSRNASGELQIDGLKSELKMDASDYLNQ